MKRDLFVVGKKYFVRKTNYNSFIEFCRSNSVPLSVSQAFINGYIILESFQHYSGYTKLKFGGEGSWWYKPEAIELIEEYKGTTQEEMDV